MSRFLWLLGLFLCGGAWARDCSFLARLLSKPLPYTLSDLKNVAPKKPLTVRLKEGSSESDWYRAVGQWPIAKMVATSGHLILREPEQIPHLIKLIDKKGGGNFSKDPLVLNLVVSPKREVLFVDVWDAHHRMAAYHAAGYKMLKEIPFRNLKMVVNGQDSEGEERPHYLQVAGMDFDKLNSLKVLKVGVPPGDVAPLGSYSNFQLGSRATVKQIAKNNMRDEYPSIGIWQSESNKVTLKDQDRIERWRESHDLWQVLIVPPNERAIDGLQGQYANDPSYNIYLGGDELREQHGNSVFLNHVKQIYGTQDVRQLRK